MAIARQKLAAMWGAQQPDFAIVSGTLSEVMQTVPSLDALQPYLAENPDLARWETELRLGQASLSAEKAARIPDLHGAVGVVHFSVGLPLPLFDRNQGNIAAATHGLAKAEAERLATEIALSAELAEAHALLIGAHQRVTALRDKVVPAMEAAFRAAHEGYQHMLDAQRGLLEARAALLDAQSGYQDALIDIQRLTGTPLNTIQ